MNIVRKTITITTKQDEWIKSQIEKENFTNDSEYFRALLRKDQEEKSKLHLLKAAIEEGFDSGESQRSIEEIFSSILEKRNMG